MKLIAYDFDKTLYDGDSSFHFWFFFHLRKPYLFLLLPFYLLLVLAFFLHLISFEILKQGFFVYMNFAREDEMMKFVDAFWEKKSERFYPWVKSQIQSQKNEGATLVCMSASPEFLLKGKVAELGFDGFFGTRYRRKNGRITSRFDGKNCKGEEKLSRLDESKFSFKNGYEMTTAFSDHLSDLPMLCRASKAYLVVDGKIRPFLKEECQ